MSELKNKYLDFGGLSQYDGLIKTYITNAINVLDGKIGNVETEGGKTLSQAVTELNAALEGLKTSLEAKDGELEGAINDILGDLASLEDSDDLMSLAEISKKLKNFDALAEQVSANAQDIVNVEARVDSLEETVGDSTKGLIKDFNDLKAYTESLGDIEGGEGLGGMIDAKIAALDLPNTYEKKGYADTLVKDAEGKSLFDAAGSAAAAQSAAEATASADATEKADAAESAAKTYAAGLVQNEDGTSKFDEKGAANAAQTAAAADATEKANAAQAAAEATAAADATAKANAAQSSAIEAAAADATSKADAAQAAAEATAAADATAKANAAQAAAEATAAADATSKADAAQAAALDAAKQYVDAIAHAANVDYDAVNKTINLYDANGEKIGAGFDATPFIVDGMLENVNFVDDSDSDAVNTKLRFTFNTDGGKKEIDVDFSDYVDVYKGDGTSIELNSNTFSVKEVAATKTKTVDTIPVAGGPLESLLKNAGITEIAAGSSIEDILFSLICKELWAKTLTFSEGTVSSSISAPSFTLTKDGSNVSGTVEIGTKVTLSDITMGSATASISKNRTYSGFTYGYSALNDNSQDNFNTTITAGVDSAAALNEGNYTMSRDYTGFNNATDDSATADADASKVKLSGATLVVGDGTNKVKVTVGGPTASATFAAMPVYYACSNLKKTKDAAKDSDGQYKSDAKSANTVTSNNASNSKELSVTGKRYMFWGAHSEHKTLDSSIIRAHANGDMKSTQATTVTITIPESGVNQFYVALPSGRTLTKVYNTAAGEQFGEVTDSFTSSTIAVEGAEGYTSANYTVWTFNSGTAWVGPNTLTVIIG